VAIVSPSGAQGPFVDPLATALGLVNWNFNFQTNITQTTPTSQTIYASGIWLPFGKSVGHVIMGVAQAASGTAITAGYMGLASPTAIIAQTASLGSTSAAYPSGYLSGALTAPYVPNATDSPLGLYYVLLLLNGTFGTTQPGFLRGNGNTGLVVNPATNSSATNLLSATVGTGQATLPANGTALTFMNTNGVSFGVAVAA